MNKTILFVVSFFAANAVWAQQVSTAAPSKSTEAADKRDTVKQSSLKKGDTQKTMQPGDDDVEIGGDKIKLQDLYKAYLGVLLESHEVEEKDEAGESVKKFVGRRVFANSGADHVLRHNSILSGRQDENIGSYEKSVFELYDIKGNKLFEKELGNLNVAQAWIFKNGTSIVYANEKPDLGVDIDRYQIYDKNGKLLNEILNTAGLAEWQIAEYKPATKMYVSGFNMSPQADMGIFTVKVSDKKYKLYKLEPNGILTDMAEIAGNSPSVVMKSANRIFIFDEEHNGRTAFSGKKYWNNHIMFFRDSILQWEITLEAEDFLVKYGGWSKTGKYLIVGYLNEITWKRNRPLAWKEYYKVIDISTGKIVAEGLRDDAVIEQYKAELLPK